MDHCNDVDPVSPRKYIYILSGFLGFFWLACFVVIFLWSWREPTFRFEMSEWYRLPCIINLSDSSSCRMHSFRSQVLLLDLLSYMLVCIYFQWKADRNLKLWTNISRYRPHGISILWKQVIDHELFYYFFFLISSSQNSMQISKASVTIE